MRSGQSLAAGRGLSCVMELEMDSLNRGALLHWLSQYPQEEEVRFGPLTGLEKLGETAILGAHDGPPTRHIFFRLTANQHALRIEELVARRKTMHIDMLENLMDELAGTPAELLDLLGVKPFPPLSITVRKLGGPLKLSCFAASACRGQRHGGGLDEAAATEPAF